MQPVSVVQEIFKKPRGRPLGVVFQTTQALEKEASLMLGKKRVKNTAHLKQFGSDQKVQRSRLAKLVDEVSEFENLIKSPTNKIAQTKPVILNPEEIGQHRTAIADTNMTEEQELKLIVKNVAKKLTYDEEEKVSYRPQVQDASINNHHKKFDIMLSDGGESANRQEDFDYEMEDASDEEEAYGNEIDERQQADRTETEYFSDSVEDNLQGGKLQMSVKNQESNRQCLQDKLRNLNLSSSVSDINFNFLQAVLKRQNDNPHLYKVGPTKYQDGSTKGHWTQQEDIILTDAVSRNNQKNWKKIAEDLPGRTDVQCLHRWQKVLNPCLVKGPWTEEEDRMVLTLVQEKGALKWTQIAEHLDGRIGKQCRERWHNHLNPMIKKNPWSREEEWILYICHRQLGNQWAEIAAFLHGRTDNTIKNHWNSSMRKKLFDFKRELESQAKKFCQEQKIDFYGVSLDQMKNYPVVFRQAIRQLEDRIQDKNQEAVRQQNKIYYELKARELLEKRDQDDISFAMAKMLLKNLNKKIEDFLPSPNKVQSNHQRKQNLTTATNATSSVRQRSNLTKSNIQTDHFNNIYDICNQVKIQPFQITSQESNYKSQKIVQKPSISQRKQASGKENKINQDRKRGRPTNSSQVLSNHIIQQTDTEAENTIIDVENDAKNYKNDKKYHTNQDYNAVQNKSPDNPKFEKLHSQYFPIQQNHQVQQIYYRQGNYMQSYLPVIPQLNTNVEDKAYQIGNFFDYGDDYNRILEEQYPNPPPISYQYSLSYNPNLGYQSYQHKQYGVLQCMQQRMHNNQITLLETPPNNLDNCNQDVAVFGQSSSSNKQLMNKYNYQNMMQGGHDLHQNIQPRIKQFRGGIQNGLSGNSLKNRIINQNVKSPQPFLIPQNESPDTVSQFINQRISNGQIVQNGLLRQSPQSNGFFNKQSPYQILRQVQFHQTYSPPESQQNHNLKQQNGAKVAPVQHVMQRRDSAFKLVPSSVVITPSRNKVENEGPLNTSKRSIQQSVCKFSMVQMNSASGKGQ